MCLYSEPNSNVWNSIICKRFPQEEIKTISDYCWEFEVDRSKKDGQ